MTAINFQAATDAFLRSKETKFRHNRLETVGASEIGQCERRVGLEKLLGRNGWDKGYVPNLGITYRGQNIEAAVAVPVVREAIKSHNVTLEWTGTQQKTFIHGPMSCTPDGLVKTGMGGVAEYDMLAEYGIPNLPGVWPMFLTEFKSFDPRSNTEKFPKNVNVKQVNAQIGIVRRVAGPFYRELSHGMILYFDASNYRNMKPYAVTYDDALFKSQELRATRIMSKVSGAKDDAYDKTNGHFVEVEAVGYLTRSLKPEGYIKGGDECEYCPFAKRCGGLMKIDIASENAKRWNRKEPELVDFFTACTANDLAETITAAEDALEQDKEFIKAKKAELAQIILEKGSSGIRTDKLDAKLEIRGGSNIYDVKAIREDLKLRGGDPEAFRKKSKPTEFVKITYH